MNEIIEETEDILIENIQEYSKNPFKAYSDKQIRELTQSIEKIGLLHSITLIKNKDEIGYTVINGHNRLRALKFLGYTFLTKDMYKLEKDLTEDEINLITVSSNLNQRKYLKFSEKAFAYKMLSDSIKQQGKRNDLSTYGQVVPKLKSNNEIGERTNESGKKIQRYIRLTHLIKELLDMLDNSKIKFTTSVEISYLKKEEQITILGMITENEKYLKKITLEKAQELKKLSMKKEDNISIEEINEILNDIKKDKEKDKENKTKVSFELEKIQSYFPKEVTLGEIKDTIIMLLEEYKGEENE